MIIHTNEIFTVVFNNSLPKNIFLRPIIKYLNITYLKFTNHMTQSDSEILNM